MTASLSRIAATRPIRSPKGSRAAAPGDASVLGADLAGGASLAATNVLGAEPEGEGGPEAAQTALAIVVGDLSVAETRGYAAGKAVGLAEGAAQAKARIKAILSSDEAKPRRAFADKLAFETDLSLEQAIDILSASPAEAFAGRLAREMASYRQPHLGAGVAPERVAPVSDLEKGAAAARELLGIKPVLASAPSRFNVNPSGGFNV